MTILTASEIERLGRSGELKIEPFYPENIQPVSIDLTLSSTYGILRKGQRPLTTSRYARGDEAIVWKTARNKILLPPGRSRIGLAQERISLPEDVLGMIIPKGRLTLRGLSLQVSMGLVQPGRRDQELYFLMTNVGSTPVELLTHDRVCQLLLFRL